MRQITGILYFYQKLVLPSLAVSLLLPLFSMKYADLNVGIGASYIIITPLFHYFTYEIKNPNEYYFYFNLGLSKARLWTCTILISFLLGITVVVL
jgi:hypothetical protein